MEPSPSGMPGEYSRTTVFNRSLSPVGRLVFLALIFSNILIVAAGFALIGAWLVLPFAGIEVAALGVAFYVISLRDSDFERFTIDNDAIRIEVRDRGAICRIEFNRAWVQMVRRMNLPGRGCTLALRSHGKEVLVGRLMSAEQRLVWSRELEGRLRIVNQ